MKVESFTTIAENFLASVADELSFQGQDPSGGRGGSHPDPQIRAFNRGCRSLIEKDETFAAHIANIGVDRPTADVRHLTDLLARTAQFMMRKEGNVDYTTYTDTGFCEWLSALSGDRFGNFLGLLRERNVATHIPERYRGLGALSSLLCQNLGRGLRIVDVGASGNLGLPAVLEPQYLLRDSSGNGYNLIDETPGQVVLTGLQRNQVRFERALGIDVQTLDFEWIFACAYFSKYDQVKLELTRDALRLHRHGIRTERADIAAHHEGREELRRTVLEATQDPLDVIHASMVMYQLTPDAQQCARGNIGEMLREEGLFVELTFEDPKNWFKDWNIISLVSQKQRGTLTSPKQWLRWNNSRCGRVVAGNNHEEVNRLIGLRQSTESILPVALLQTHAS